jgi:7,8-dihydropterin-6-yl-methyl-4-(beta-D-ribofuranosyl)aminobenzene 5'-phosphate synthase
MNEDFLTIVYDNRSLREDLVADWGFSCLVKSGGNTILFDTGAKEEILSHNLTALFGAPQDAYGVFLSHDHYDHTGGVCQVVPEYSNKCFIPESSSKQLRKTIASAGGQAICVKEGREICPHIWSSGELTGSTHEQSLVITCADQLVVIVGCAHPGVVTIVRHVTSLFKKVPSLIVGGFHWYESSIEEVEAQIGLLRKLGVKKVAPCHCTGERALSWIEENWKEGFIECTLGTKLNLRDL